MQLLGTWLAQPGHFFHHSAHACTPILSMTLTLQLASCLLIASASNLLAAPRAWKSADGQRSTEGELVSRDATSITILRTKDLKQLTIQLEQLDPNDRTWINANHPLAAAKAPTESAAFDTLAFGDSREAALTKLKASKFVEMTTDATFVGRSGMNGIFRTRRKIGTLNATLYFDWTETGMLKEITLQTDLLPADAYKSELEPSWKELVELLGTLHGKPVQKGPFPQLESLADGSFSPSHLWRLDRRGSALLGTARDGAKYQIVVRFTQKEIQPVEIP